MYQSWKWLCNEFSLESPFHSININFFFLYFCTFIHYQNFWCQVPLFWLHSIVFHWINNMDHHLNNSLLLSWSTRWEFMSRTSCFHGKVLVQHICQSILHFYLVGTCLISYYLWLVICMGHLVIFHVNFFLLFCWNFVSMWILSLLHQFQHTHCLVSSSFWTFLLGHSIEYTFDSQ